MPGYQQFTLAQMRSQAYERLGNNTNFWRSDEIDRMIRESLRIYNLLTGLWRSTASLGTTAPGRVWYVVPPGFSYLYRVEYNGYPLASSSLWDLDYGRTSWQSEIGTPQAWAPAGLRLIALWPADSSTGGIPLLASGVVPAPQPTADNDIVDLGTEDLDQVLDYVCHVAQFKEGGQEFQASLQTFQGFLKGAAARNSMLMQSSRFRAWMGLADRASRPLRSKPERVGAR